MRSVENHHLAAETGFSSEPLSEREVWTMIDEITRGRLITLDIAKRHLERLHDSFVQDPHNVVVLDALGSVGKGHFLQGCRVKEAFKKMGQEVTHITLSLQQADLLTTAGTSLYKQLQGHPSIYDVTERLINHPVVDYFFDDAISLSHYDRFRAFTVEQLQSSPHFNPQLKTLFMSTYRIATQVAGDLLKEHFDGGVIDYIPDASWKGNILRMMSALPFSNRSRRITVVHDKEVAEEFRRVRGYVGTGTVLNLGTVSHINALLGSPNGHMPTETLRDPLHLGIEFGGNYLGKHVDHIKKWLSAIALDLYSGKIMLTIHPFHEQARKDIQSHLQALGFPEQSVHLAPTNTLTESMRHLDDSIFGHTNSHPVQVWIGKGGESSIEDRYIDTNSGSRPWHPLIVGVWGGGHEGLQIRKTKQTRGVLDLRGSRHEAWLPTIRRELQKRDNGNHIPPQSLALLACLEYFYPQYFSNYNALINPY